MKIAGIVLAAGASRRLGRPKQSVVLAGETLLQRALRIARDAGLSPIIVVARPGSEWSGVATAPDVLMAINHDADEGIASSIRCGIAEALHSRIAGVVILACDQPGLRADHLRALTKDPRRVTGSAYAESIGVPAYFPVEVFSSLLQLRGDKGARALLKNAYAIEAQELKLDIDTEQDLDAARSILELHRWPD